MTIDSDSNSTSAEDDGPKLALSRLGVLLAVLFFFAGLNACSFFMRSGYPWQRLTGETKGLLLENSDVEIGFPLRVAFSPGRGLVASEQWSAFLGNVVCAVVVAVAYAIYFGNQKRTVESEVDDAVSPRSQGRWQFRFRLVHMLTITTVTAVVLGFFARAPEPSLRALKLIYLAGPCLIMWVFYALRSWPKLRSRVLLVMLMGLVGGATRFASEVFDDFTYGLFGVFVCWLPQLLTIIVVVFISQNFKAAWRAVEQSQ